MKKLALLSIFALGFTSAVFAEDKKLEGEAVCAKCELHTADKCRAAIQVKTADGKTETYLTAPNDQAKALHKEICKGGKEVTVQGAVSEEGGQKIVTITSYTTK